MRIPHSHGITKSVTLLLVAAGLAVVFLTASRGSSETRISVPEAAAAFREAGLKPLLLQTAHNGVIDQIDGNVTVDVRASNSDAVSWDAKATKAYGTADFVGTVVCNVVVDIDPGLLTDVFSPQPGAPSTEIFAGVASIRKVYQAKSQVVRVLRALCPRATHH